MIKQKKHRRSEQRREKTHFFDENLRLEAAVQAHRRCPLHRRRRCRRRRRRRRRCRSFSQKALTSEKGIFGRMFLGLTLHLVVLSSFPVRGCD